MSKKEITKQELIKELKELRQRIAELEKSETEGKKIEENLRLFSQAVDSSVDGVAMGNVEGRITYVNQAFVRMFGYSKKELIGKGMPFIYPKDQAPKLEKALKATMQGGWTGELVGKRKNGELFPMALSSSLIKDNKGTVIAHMANHKDITGRKRVEEVLRESEERFKMIFEFAPDAYYLNDLKGIFIDGNKRAEKITGYKKEELIGKSFLKLKLLSPSQATKAAVLLAKNVLGKSTGPDEFVLRRKDGTQIPVEIRTFPTQIKDRNLVLGIARDITERKQAEEALQRSEKKYRAITENVNDALIIHDFEGKIIDVNDNTCVLFGQKRNKIIGEHLPKFSPENPKNPTSSIINSLKKEKSLVFDSQAVYRDGSIIPVTISAKLVSEEDKGVIQSFIRNITERKQIEEALKRKNEDLERFNRIAVDRELKMVELKKEINALLKELGKEPQYKISAEKNK